MAETDAEFVKRMRKGIGNVPGSELDAEIDRLFAIADRGAGLTLDRQKLFTDKDGNEWVDEYYSRRLPLPPAGEQGHE